MDIVDRVDPKMDPTDPKMDPKMDPTDPKMDSTESKPDTMLDISELSETLESLRLHLVRVEDWILIQRANFDIRVNGEPYHSIQIYADLAARKYIRRVWGKSEATGEIETMRDLKDLCAASFQRSMTCIGYIGPHPGEKQLKLVHVNFPFSRWISRSCAIRCLQKQEDNSLYVGLCSACSGGTVSIEKVKRDDDGDTGGSVPFKIDNEDATYEFHAEAIVGNEDEMMDDDEEEDEEDEDYDPDNDYIKEEEELLFDDDSGKKEFTCNICGLACESKSGLTKHENIFHLDIKHHECGECGHRCKNLEDLKRHTDFECGNDDDDDDEGEGRESRKRRGPQVTGPRDHVCDDCGAGFTSLNGLKYHHRSFHLKIKNYFCKFCNMAFSQSGNARRHERRCASMDNINNGGSVKNEDNEENEENDNEEGIKKEVKDEDSKDSSEREAAVEKRKREVNARMHHCEFCDYKTIRKDNMQKHVDNMHEMEGEDYDCEKCDFVTRRKGKLKTHMIKVHHVSPTYSCKECPFVAGKWSELRKHARKEHLKEEDGASKGDKSSGSAASAAAKNPATCDQCGLTLESLSGLQHHIKSIHGAYSDREHKCDYPGCSKAYITAAALKTHYQGSHAGGLVCDFCGERRTQKHSLENHIRVVHKKLPPKANLKCQFCEEVFKNPEAKRRHTGLVHFPEKHKCTICLRSCYSAFRLQLHMRTHSGRTYDCQECGKSLKSDEGLKIHMRLHTGDLFKCDYCSWQGNTRVLLRRHKKRIHKLEWEKEVALIGPENMDGRSARFIHPQPTIMQQQQQPGPPPPPAIRAD